MDNVTIQAVPRKTSRVGWLLLNHTYQIQTFYAFFALAKVVGRDHGNIKVTFFGAPPGRQRPDAPLIRMMRAVKQTKDLPVKTIISAREIL